MKFSAVITTYRHEKVEYFKEALTSLVEQTVPPTEIIVLFDGPGVSKQKKVAINIKSLYSNIDFKIIELEENVGRGEARNIAIKNASFPLIAIMDSDDISCNSRFEHQLKIFNKKNVDLVASWQEEFTEKDNSFRKIKKCPEKDEDIKHSLKFRCLIPNPSIIFKKEMFDKVGGYGKNRLLGEDHILFAKMALSGAKFYCIQEPLIKVRINPDQRKRRGGWRAISEDFKLRHFLYKSGYINLFEMAFAFTVFTIFRLMPTKIKDIIFSIIRDDK